MRYPVCSSRSIRHIARIVCFESQTVSLLPTMALWLLNVVDPL